MMSTTVLPVLLSLLTAVRRLTEAKRIVSQSGLTPMLARIDPALAELV
jgi:hypothetical protein